MLLNVTIYEWVGVSCAGVSLWYDLHGASYAGLEAANDLLAQHPAVFAEPHAEGPHHGPL